MTMQRTAVPSAEPSLSEANRQNAREQDPSLPVMRYHVLLRPMGEELVPYANDVPGSLRLAHAWDLSVEGEKRKIPGGLYIGYVVTHLDLADWLAMHHYRMEKFISQRFASTVERTVVR